MSAASSAASLLQRSSATARACSTARVGSSQVVKAQPRCSCSPSGPWLWVTVPVSSSSRRPTPAEVSTSLELGRVARSTHLA